MAIRAGELGLPSVIGAGEVLYRRWSKANRLHVDCARTQGRDLSVKTVAVSQRIDDYPDRNERRDALRSEFVFLLITSGFIPIPVPNRLTKYAVEPSAENQNELGSWLEIFNPSAILLSGGNSVGSCPDRDRTEKID